MSNLEALQGWEMSAAARDHYENPRHAGSLAAGDPAVGSALVRLPGCRDVLRLQIRVGAGDIIEQACFKAQGSGFAIACGSLAAQWLTGATLAEASAISSARIGAALQLPPLRQHCAVLAEEAIRAALDDYLSKSARPAVQQV